MEQLDALLTRPAEETPTQVHGISMPSEHS